MYRDQEAAREAERVRAEAERTRRAYEEQETRMRAELEILGLDVSQHGVQRKRSGSGEDSGHGSLTAHLVDDLGWWKHQMAKVQASHTLPALTTWPFQG